MTRESAPKILLLTLAYLAFVSLGLPDAALGLAWPSLVGTFALPQAALGLPLAAGAATYFLSGLLAGRLLEAFGVGSLLAVSTGIVAVAVAGYALAPSFSVFLASACIVGFGSGAIDAGLNSYAATHFGARHMTWLHAAYSAGAALGSATLTVLFASGLGWRYGYATIAAALSALAVGFIVTRRSWRSAPRARAAENASAVSAGTGSGSSAWSALHDGRVVLQMALFFVYSGVELGIGQWSYSILTQGRRLDAATAGLYVTSYWASLLLGRLLAGFIVEAVGTVRLLRMSTAAATLGAALFASRAIPVEVSALGLSVVGFAIAPIYPGLMAETPRRVGSQLSPHAVGFQVSAAIAGVAVLPNVGGLIGEWWNLDAIAWFVAACAIVLCALHELVVQGEKVASPLP